MINSDDIEIINALINNGAQFLLKKPLIDKKGMFFDYNSIDNRDASERYKDNATEKYDKIKMLQMKQILNSIV